MNDFKKKFQSLVMRFFDKKFEIIEPMPQQINRHSKEQRKNGSDQSADQKNQRQNNKNFKPNRKCDSQKRDKKFTLLQKQEQYPTQNTMSHGY